MERYHESEVVIPLMEEEQPQHKPTKIEDECSFGSIVLSLILNVLMMPLFFLPLWASFFTVAPQEEILILRWGKLVARHQTPGIYWNSFIGRTMIKMSTKIQNFELKRITVLEKQGTPIVVSGVVTFKIMDTIRAAFDVQNVNEFMERQAMATLKKVCSKYPYESKDGISLQTEANQVAKEMVAALQAKAQICGVKVISFELADLQYAPEIAQGMLVRQQAQALLDARRVIVDGAVSIVTSAVTKLEDSGVKLNEREATKLVSNLLAVICADAKVQPMFSISESVDAQGANTEMNAEMLKTLQQIASRFPVGQQ